MRIAKIDIENYRAIRSMSVDLKDRGDVLVFAGLNGSGKSSFLEAVLTALGNPFEMRESLVDQSYRVALTLQDGFIEFPDPIVAVPGQKPRRLPNFTAMYFSSWRAPKRVHGVTLKIGKKGKRPAKEDRNALWNLKQWLVSLPSLAHYPSGQELASKIRQIFDEIDQMWNDFFPGRGERFEADLEKGGAEEMQMLGTGVEPKFELYLKRSFGRISVDELSSGEIELLSLFGTLIADRIMTGKPLDFAFIDEPELHLNSIWHRKLIPMLEKYAPGTQLFVATHSPSIWDSVYSSQRLFLKGGEVVNEIREEL